MANSSKKTSSSLDKNLFQFDISEVHDYDMPNMKTPSSLEIRNNPKLLKANAPRFKTLYSKKKRKKTAPTMSMDMDAEEEEEPTNISKSLKGNRLPYLKDVFLQDDEPSRNLLSKSAIIMEKVENLNKKTKKQVAPDDTEEIAKLKTGEDAIAFFSRAGKSTAVKFVYLNRVELTDIADYRPYELEVCDREQTQPEHFTMSASGVVHIQPNQPTEFMSLSDWMRESTIFNVLRRIRFFKYYLLSKAFKIWRKNSHYQRYCKTRAKLARRFFIGKRTFNTILMEMKKKCYKLQSIPIMDFTEKKSQNDATFGIQEFHQAQVQQRAQATSDFEQNIYSVEQLLVKLCKSVTARARVDNMNNVDNIEVYLAKSAELMPDSGKKSKSMVQAQQEALAKQRALRKAKEEADMLSNFIRLADYMATESLITLSKNTLLQFFFNMKEAHSIVFKVKINFTDDSMVFTPTENEIQLMFNKNASELIESVYKVPRLINMRNFKLYFDDTLISIDIKDAISRDKSFSDTTSSINAMLHQRFGEAIEYGASFNKLMQWFDFGKQWNSVEYKQQKHTVKQFNRDLDKVNRAHSDLKRMNLTEDKGILVVESRNLKRTLEPLMDGILDEIKVAIQTTSRNMCKVLYQEFKTRAKTLKERPNKLRDFAMFVHNLNTIKDEARSLMKQADEVEKMYELAMKNKVPIDNPDLVQLEELKEEKDQFIIHISNAEAFRDNNILSRTRELEENIQRINTELFNTMAVLRTGLFVSAEADTEDVIHSLNKLEESIKNMRSRTEKFSEYKRLFNAKSQEWTNLKDVEAQFALRKEIWTTLAEFDRITETWKNTDHEKIDAEEIERTIQQTYIKAHKLSRKSQDQVTAHLKDTVKLWRERIPVILMIGNKDLKQVHWQKIFKGMGVVLSLTSSYTLKNLTNLGIFEQRALVSEVSAQASGEADLQKMLEAIEKAWRNMEFVVKPYRDRKDCYILGTVEEIIQQLEDNMVSLQTMQASPFIAGVKSKVEKWERDLKLLQELIEEWLTCQKKWIYLEFIFSSDDIKRQLHEEAAKFAAVDNEFVTIMRKTNHNKKVLSIVKPEILEKFQECNGILEDVQKNLEDFLGTKREAFARFFFLSNDELIEILSQTREPRAVQPHLSKCFDSIKFLEFKDEGSNEIVGMISGGKEPEHVSFSSSVFALGNVEHWLQNIEDMMRETLFDLMKTSLKTYGGMKREDWILDHLPAQCILTVDQIIWTKGVERALSDIETGSNRNALIEYREKFKIQIDNMVRMIRTSELSHHQRTVINALLVLDVHSLDVVDNLIRERVTSASDFKWTMQLRYYWDHEVNNCVIKQTSAQFVYGYEYLGNQPRLVITPLTDRCYMTLTGALNMCLGGSPQGPAGTGKTETVKDLAKSLARQCVVFNCSEGLRVAMMRQMFSGLAQAGAWACFDEFNRIDIEVLSVVAQYMRTIQTAVMTKQEHFIFDDRDIVLNPNYGVFITMNPGYVGRTELPDNLKAMFRPVAMMIPDYALIAEIMLYAEGFDTARSLAQKMVQLFRLSSEQLSKQDHYDFGMRAVKSILVCAGALKRDEPNLPEDILLIRAMKDSNVPKFLKNDVILFENMIQDLFPGKTVPAQILGPLQRAIELQLTKKKLQVIPSQVTKIMQVQATMQVRHGVMLVGRPGTGKTVAHTVLAESLSKLSEAGYENEYFVKVVPHILNPKSIRMEELYGDVHELTKDWHDGLIANMARTAVKDTTQNHWIVFDGPVDSLWIENMNTVLDDNRMLCLTNGERIKLPTTVRLLFEVLDLAVASPATVSRCGMVYFEEENVDMVWKPILKSWCSNKYAQEYTNLIEDFANKAIEPTLEFIRQNCEEYIPSLDSNLVQSFLTLLEGLFKPDYGIDFETGLYYPPEKPVEEKEEDGELGDEELLEEEPEELEEDGEIQAVSKEGPQPIKIDMDRMIRMQIIYSFIWSLGANLTQDSRDKFDFFTRKYIKEFCDWFPEESSIFDYYINIIDQQWGKWVDIVPQYVEKPKFDEFFNIHVPTVDSVRYQHLAKCLISANRNILLTGQSGVGKTVLVGKLMRDDLNVEDPASAFTGFAINLSAQTTSANLREIFEDKLDSKRKNLLGAPNGKKGITFVDDLNMPKLDLFGSQPPIELLRQIIDQGGFYDVDKLFFKHVQDIVLVAACAPPGGGRNDVTGRLLRHFHMLNFTTLKNESMHTIFRSILNNFWDAAGADSTISSIVDGSLALYKKVGEEMLPRPSTSHYTFNLRDVSKLFQGLMQVKVMPNITSLKKLWLHESARVFKDRLVCQEDRDWFEKSQIEIWQEKFQEDITMEDTQVLFGDYIDGEVYEEISDDTKLMALLEESLEDYAVEHSALNLVFFKDAISHLSRICRILRQPRGNALLVGVGGSGRHSLTRLAAHMQEYKCIELEVTKNFNMKIFLENMKEMLLQAGCDNKQIVFLFSDTQIVQEGILEAVHNLLNSGEIANIFQAEDYDQILKSCRSEMRTTRDAIYRHFVSKVRENLHIVMCMSPVGNSFRDRIRMFPALVNNCTIDWYNAWPDEALYEVSEHFLKDIENLRISGIENDEVLEKVCKLCVYVSSTVREYSDKFLVELRRYNYTTPTSYLELINLYTNMLETQKDTYNKSLHKYEKGLSKLADTNNEVAVMKVELKEKQPKLEQAVIDTEEIEKTLMKEKEEADAFRTVCVKEEQKCQVEMDNCQAIRDSCQADLDKAMPAFRASVKALRSLNKEDIYEIKSFKIPPPLVQTVMEGVCILFKKNPDWKESQSLLNDTNFLRNLENYPKDKIKSSLIKKLKVYVDKPDFKPDIVKKVNVASKSLCMWVIAMHTYAVVNKKIQPKKAKLAESELKLNQATKIRDEKREQLRKIEEKVESLQQQYEAAINKKKALQAEIQQTEDRLGRAEKLLAGLSTEKVRWAEESEKLKLSLSTIIGDILLASGFVAYLGPFNSAYRKELFQQWFQKCEEVGIPVNPSFTLDDVVEAVTVRDWVQNALPSDKFSIENAILSSKCNRWPLFIDPQGQANKWIKNIERNNGIKILKSGDSDNMRKLEAAIRVGIPCLLENVGETLDAALEPILLKQTFRQGGRLLIRIGDQDVDYNQNFKLYITTKLPNPHYKPETCIKVTIINFTVTQAGLEDQLLADVVSHERPELEKQKNTLVTQIAYGKNQLKECEDKILELLFKESDKHILDDIDLIEALKDSKLMSETITKSVEQAEETEKTINQTREKYRDVARRGSILYFVISDMSGVDPMYQYSLQFFQLLFGKCLADSEKSDEFAKRIQILKDYTTETTYKVICRGLFQRDKLLFAVMMTVQILRHENLILEDEWQFFLQGSRDISDSEVEWLPDPQWRALKALSVLDGFEELLDNVKEDSAGLWRDIFENQLVDDANYTKIVLPEPFQSKLSHWRKVLLLKCFREEKLIFGVTQLVSVYLGPEFVEAPQVDLSGAFKDSNEKTPIVFILSTGADPARLFYKFAEDQNRTDRVLSLSLGQGQGVKAAQMIQQAQFTGEWVFLQNCHLAVSWMPELERIIEETNDKDQVHKDFRLWLTSMPCKDFPVTVLQQSIKLTNEPPKGLRANLKQSFSNMTVETYEDSNRWKKLLYGVVFFHAVLQERRKYGSLGWNVQYSWNTSDLEASISSLKLYLKEKDIEWEALAYVIGVIHYGGRVTDFLDLRCVNSIFKQFIGTQVLEENFSFDEANVYYAPPKGSSLNETIAHIKSLPQIEEPEIFGLHKNANITFQQQDTRSLLNTIIAMQPRNSGSGGGQSNDEIVLEMVEKMIDEVPAIIDTTNAHPVTFDPAKENCLGVFLTQEVESFNKLLSTMHTTLKALKQAIGGFVVMSPELEKMYQSFLYKRVPENWSAVSYPSRMSLQYWFEDLKKRVDMLVDWVNNGPPKSYWISAFFFPQGFLTSVLQTHARKNEIPIDALVYRTHVYAPEETVQRPDSGVLVTGLFLEGAGWDMNKSNLIESTFTELHVQMPTIWLEPVLKKAVDHSKLYECPLYKTAERAGELSTTGISTNFVLSLHLNPGSKSVDHWIQRSVALLCMKD